MIIRWIPHVLAGSFLLVGCGARHVHPDSDTLLLGAHASLERGALIEADQRLNRAEASVCTERGRETLEILRAETDIRARDPGRARIRMAKLLQHDPEDPRAHEVAGKAELRLADFSAASWHFEVALRNYSTDFDRGRVSDLLALSNGLSAYSSGQLQAAQDAWARIKDRELRAHVLEAYSVVAPQARARPALTSGYSLNIAR